jgi:hypothetical protein
MFSLAKTLRARAAEDTAERETRLAEAETWLQRVEQGRTELLVPNHSGTWNARVERTLVARECGRTAEARTLLADFVARLRDAGALSPVDHAEGVQQLIRWCREDGQEAEAERFEDLLQTAESPMGKS